MRRFRPACELLEDRAQPAVFTVTDPLDLLLKDGSPVRGSLRWAIEQASQHPNRLNLDESWDEIHFQLPAGPGPFVIQMNAPLGPVLEPVILDASQQPRLSIDRDALQVVLPQWPDLDSFENMQRINVEFRLDLAEPGPSDRPEVPEFPGDPAKPAEPELPIDEGPSDPPPPPPRRPREPEDPVEPEIPGRSIDPSIPGLLIDPAPPSPNEIASVDAFFRLPAQLRGQLPGRPKRYPTALAEEDGSVFLAGNDSEGGKIIGMLFEDYNGDGRHDPDEPPAVQRIVYLDLDKNGRLDEGEPIAVTNEQGQYRFEDLRPGYYQVEQLLWPYLVQTLPRSGGNRVDLSAGEVIMNVDFGAVKVRTRRVNVSAPDGDSRLPGDSRLLSGLAPSLLLGGLLGQRTSRSERRAALADGSR